MKKLINPVLDFLPLIVFFVINSKNGIMSATIALIITTPITIFIYYLINKKIPKTQIITLAFILVFGSLTIIFNDEMFIKIKPTLVNLLLAIILILGLLFKKIFLKTILSPALNLSDKGWIITTKAWIIFFIFIALTNEVIWRSFSTDTWVTFKVFGILPLTFIFTIVLFTIISKHMITNEKK